MFTENSNWPIISSIKKRKDKDAWRTIAKNSKGLLFTLDIILTIFLTELWDWQ